MLAQAKAAEVNRAATDKAAKELEAEQTARRQHEARVAEVEQELKDAICKCEALERKTSDQSYELTKALHEAKEVRSESRSAREEIHQARQIAAGKAFLLQSIFGGQRYCRGYTSRYDPAGVITRLGLGKPADGKPADVKSDDNPADV